MSPPTRAQQLRAAAVRAFMQPSCPGQFPSPFPETSHSRSIQHASLQHKRAAGAHAEAATDMGSQTSDEGSVGSSEGGAPRMAGLARWVAAEGIEAAPTKELMSKQHVTGRAGPNDAHKKVQPDAAGTALTESTKFAQQAQHGPQHGAQQAQHVQQPLQPHVSLLPDSSFGLHKTAHDPQAEEADMAADAGYSFVSKRFSHTLHDTQGYQSQATLATAATAITDQDATSAEEQSKPIVDGVQHSEQQQTAVDLDREVSSMHVNPEVAQLITDFSNSQLAEFEQSCTSKRLVAIHVRSERSLQQR